MKKLIAILSFSVIYSYATPVYYTFQGTVTSSLQESIKVNDSFNYVILIDSNKNGADVHHEHIFTYPDYIYAECLTPLPNDLGTPFSDKPFIYNDLISLTGDPISYIWASNGFYYENPTSGDRTVALQINGSRFINDWFIGENDFTGDLAYAGVDMDFSLIDISDSNPMVPEPNQSVLFAVGLFFVAIILRKTPVITKTIRPRSNFQRYSLSKYIQIFTATPTVLVLLNFAPANATLVDNGNYTTDTETSLDWLDVSGTTGISVDYVKSQMGTGGIYQGWEYATVSQVTEFLNHAGGSGVYQGYSEENNGLYNKVATLLGTTYGTVSDGYIAVATADLINPDNSTYVHLFSIRDWFEYDPDPINMDYVDFGWHMRIDLEYQNEGHALIRHTQTVPELNSFCFAIIGILALLFVFRKKGQYKYARQRKGIKLWRPRSHALIRRTDMMHMTAFIPPSVLLEVLKMGRDGRRHNNK